MIIGQTFPIRIQVLSEPPIDLTAAGTELHIRVTNNKVTKFTFGPGQGDGEVGVEADANNDNTWAVAEGLTRDQSLQINTGQIMIELLMKTDDASFPDGFFTIAKFIEPVEESTTTDIV